MDFFSRKDICRMYRVIKISIGIFGGVLYVVRKGENMNKILNIEINDIYYFR